LQFVSLTPSIIIGLTEYRPSTRIFQGKPNCCFVADNAAGHGKMRLFYALIPSQEVIAALQPLMARVEGARWQTEDQLHLTLRFLGNVDRGMVSELSNVLPRDEPLPLPPLQLSGVGNFEGDAAINALWVGVDPTPALTDLHQLLNEACRNAGLSPDPRAYRPHITVARLSRSSGPCAAWLERHAGFSNPNSTFARCSLLQSITTPQGSQYRQLASINLR
jgi:2'-5' RNA ligase